MGEIPDRIIEEVMDEASRALRKYGKLKSMHEAYSVLLEELDEFWDVVKGKGNVMDARRELTQICAAAILAIRDLT